MREEKKRQSAETDVQEQHQTVTFPIWVRNKFDLDPRRIKVFHKDKYHKDKKKDTLSHIVKNQHIQKDEKNEERYDLLLDECLVIELGEEDGDFREFFKDVYIGLPFLSDYEFFWESVEENKKQLDTPIRKRVDRPITSIRKDTRPDSEKQTEKGRTVIKIPGDQRAWKLKIWRPGNLEEYHQPENLHTENLEMQSGDPDDVTVSDNGPG